MAVAGDCGNDGLSHRSRKTECELAFPVRISERLTEIVAAAERELPGAGNHDNSHQGIGFRGAQGVKELLCHGVRYRIALWLVFDCQNADSINGLLHDLRHGNLHGLSVGFEVSLKLG
ncbi:hypothetical protein BIWAKO_06742 [Bosea sp. BIWAKO-01]|nr:hypothetical protein BIWAKO_06742 [Bosea sp. BIWAKO-01]